MSGDAPGDWADRLARGDPPAPVVLVLGGFLTSPPNYLAFVRRLRERGAADVVVAGIWLPDWLLAGWRGLGPVLTRSGRALLEASRRAQAAAAGAPVLVVGHSAGGMVARLLTSPEPHAGRRLGASGRIGAIVTLGTPHVVAGSLASRNRVAAETAAFANRVVPGPAFAPTTGYLAVGSTRGVGRPDGTLAERRRWAVYRELAPGDPAPPIHGDGLVPVACTVLPGARHVVLDDAVHGQLAGRPWYGAEPAIDRWWPLALEAWHAALHARAGRPPFADADRPALAAPG